MLMLFRLTAALGKQEKNTKLPIIPPDPERQKHGELMDKLGQAAGDLIAQLSQALAPRMELFLNSHFVVTVVIIIQDLLTSNAKT